MIDPTQILFFLAIFFLILVMGKWPDMCSIQTLFFWPGLVEKASTMQWFKVENNWDNQLNRVC